MNNIKRGDIVVYKNKCMKVIDIKEDDYKIEDILTNDVYTTYAEEIRKTGKCLNNFYTFGEIE